MGLKTFPGGIHSDDFKRYSKNSPIELFLIPERVVIPLSQHIGAPSKPIVKVGDSVKTGQLICEAGGFVSIPMHASITGKVTKIGRFPHPIGNMQYAIEIIGNGTDEWVELVDDENFMELSVEEMRNRISDAGICGMGGAGFPTHVKLSPPPDKKIDTVIINGVECEPYLTADYRLMLERSEDILKGLRIFMKIVGAKKGYIGIEANKPDAISLFKQILAKEKDLEVVGLQLKYPQGAEKQLIYACTQRKVPNKGGLPMDVGVIVQNVGTAIASYEAVRYKKPLIDRVITVTGRIVNKPKNLQARIGSLFNELLDHCAGTSEEIAKIISGGPMMGYAISTLNTPLAKGSSGLILFDSQEAKKRNEQTCIRCCSCVDVCPMNLMPSMIVSSVQNNDWESARRAGAVDCIKCGCCAYVCPAHIKMIQWIDIGKNKITEIDRTKKEKQS
ncbi:MAG: electron transport complex subunit RsxC [Candidatus Cloacimonetes bacterium]|nr:electron transport complex subunit RsxC [Candidatus Cloacimonadota bacterium]